MQEYTFERRGGVLTLSAPPGYDDIAAWLVGLLDDVPQWRAGYVIQAGWNLFVLRQTERGYRLEALDYAGDPQSQTTPDLSMALWVHVSQALMLKRAAVSPEGCRFDDRLIVQRGCLDAHSVLLQRLDPARNGNSGWYLSFAEGPRAEEGFTPANAQSLPTYKLLLHRRSLLPLLLLPVGCATIFDGQRHRAIVDLANDVLISAD